MYWALAKRENLVSSRQEEEFYRKLLVGLRRGDLIFDVGANRGAKTDIFLRLGARVVAVEPDDSCQAILRDRFCRYRLRSSPVTLVDRAVSDTIGVEELLIDGPGSAVNTMSRKWADHLKGNKEGFKYQHGGLEFSNSKSVPTTTLDDLVNRYGAPFFVKIDVEGHELSVLLGLRDAVPFLSFEVNLRMFRPEGIRCVQVLKALRADGGFNYTPDCCSGLVLDKWLPAEEFCSVLETCTDETIEVFWRSSFNLDRSRVMA
jgi:FkbM family methyltransferase